MVLIEVDTCFQRSNPSFRVLVSSLLVGVLWTLGTQPAAAYNSEEHKACTDLAISKLDVDPAVVFWDATEAVFVAGDSATDRASYEEAKKLAVGFTTNGPDDYDAHTACQDNDYYSILPGYFDQMGTASSVGSGNLWIWTPPEEILATTRLEIPTNGDQGEPFSLGQLVAFYGDYRKTTWCDDDGDCYLLNGDTMTDENGETVQSKSDAVNGGDNAMHFLQGNYRRYSPKFCNTPPCTESQDYNDWTDAEVYLKGIGSGIWPPFGMRSAVFNTAENDTDFFEAGWWGDDMMRGLNHNDWHFSTAALAWYVGLHRIALQYVEMAIDEPKYWKAAMHYEANALHTYTDLFAFGHMLAHRGPSSYANVEGSGLLANPTYLWMQNVLNMGGAERVAHDCDGFTGEYICSRVEYPSEVNALPLVSEPSHDRDDLMLTYSTNLPEAWVAWPITENAIHTAFNTAGACVRNLNGDYFYIYGDGYMREMVATAKGNDAAHCGVSEELVTVGIEAVANGVAASVQSLLDAYLQMKRGEASLAELTTKGSLAFDALRYLPAYVVNNPIEASGTTLLGNAINYGSENFQGHWVAYAGPLDDISGAGVLPEDWDACAIPYIDGGTDMTLAAPELQPMCQEFPEVDDTDSGGLDSGGLDSGGLDSGNQGGGGQGNDEQPNNNPDRPEQGSTDCGGCNPGAPLGGAHLFPILWGCWTAARRRSGEPAVRRGLPGTSPGTA